jgi:Na+/proline symporter
MSNVVGNLSSQVGGAIGTVVGGAKSWVETQWTQRLVQISVFAAVISWVLGNYKLVDQVDKVLTKTFSLKLGHDGTRVLHAIIFGFFMYFVTRLVLDPFVQSVSNSRLVEGNANRDDKSSSKK